MHFLENVSFATIKTHFESWEWDVPKTMCALEWKAVGHPPSQPAGVKLADVPADSGLLRGCPGECVTEQKRKERKEGRKEQAALPSGFNQAELSR